MRVRLGNGTLLHVVAGRAERPHRPGLGRDPPGEAARRRRTDAQLADGEIIERAYVGVSTQYVVRPPWATSRSTSRGPGRTCRASSWSCRSRRTQRSSFPDRRRFVHERVVHPRSAAAARARRRCVPERSRTARRLRRRPKKAAATVDQRDRADAAEDADASRTGRSTSTSTRRRSRTRRSSRSRSATASTSSTSRTSTTTTASSGRSKARSRRASRSAAT